MASVFKPTYTKLNPVTGQKVTRRAKRWYAQYKTADGRWKRVPGYTDKEATRQLAARLERRASREAVGLVDPHEQHLLRPLAEHVNDFAAYLRNKGNTDKHVGQTKVRIERIADECGFRRLRDFTASTFTDWLTEQREAGEFGCKTSNYYLGSLKSFCRWLVRDRRMPDNPLAHLTAMNADADVRVQRRSLLEDEFSRLVAAAEAGEPFRALAGKDRAMLYLTAAYTGLRASELHSLTAASFSAVAEEAALTVEAAYSKRRRKDVQPIPRQFVTALKEWVKGRPNGELLWPGTWQERAAKMVRGDMAAAREKWIKEVKDPAEIKRRQQSPFLCERDEQGRVFDFHALRHQYISNLAHAGVHPKIAQILARHSTITLTLDRYTHVQSPEIVAALSCLPPLKTAAESSKEDLAQQLAQASDIPCQRPSPAGTNNEEASSNGRGKKSPETRLSDAIWHQQETGVAIIDPEPQAALNRTSNPQVTGSIPVGGNDMRHEAAGA